jgi:hypothetical protein
MAGRVEHQAACLQRFAGAGRRRAAQDGVDPRQQFARTERLGDVVIRATFEARDLVVLVGARREHDHWHVLGVLVALDGTRELETTLVGQHPVHEQQVGTLVSDARARGRAVLGLTHVESGPAQAERDHVPNRLFVLDDQNLHARHDAPELAVSLQQNYRLEL